MLYIPVCPVTARNAEYVRRQLERFRKGHPGPDFPGGQGEEGNIDRPTEQDLTEYARRSMGLERLAERDDSGIGTRRLNDVVNRIWGFS